MSEEALKAVESRDRVIDDLKAAVERYKAAVGVAVVDLEHARQAWDQRDDDGVIEPLDKALATLRGLKG